MTKLEILHQEHLARWRRFRLAAKKCAAETEPVRLDVKYKYPRSKVNKIAPAVTVSPTTGSLIKKGVRLPNGVMCHHTVTRIKARVARFSGVSVSEMESNSRRNRTIYVRDRAIWLCVKYTKKDAKIIASGFGDRDYRAVMNSNHKVESAKNYKNRNPDGHIVVGDLTFRTKKAAAFHLFEKLESVENIARIIGSSVRSVRVMRCKYMEGE